MAVSRLLCSKNNPPRTGPWAPWPPPWVLRGPMGPNGHSPGSSRGGPWVPRGPPLGPPGGPTGPKGPPWSSGGAHPWGSQWHPPWDPHGTSLGPHLNNLSKKYLNNRKNEKEINIKYQKTKNRDLRCFPLTPGLKCLSFLVFSQKDTPKKRKIEMSKIIYTSSPIFFLHFLIFWGPCGPMGPLQNFIKF